MQQDIDRILARLRTTRIVEAVSDTVTRISRLEGRADQLEQRRLPSDG
jgi:hypothetical protein